MNQDIKQRWIEALRSGEYKQGRGVLRFRSVNTDRFCSIGVLCDVVDPDCWEDVPTTEKVAVISLRGETAFLGLTYTIQSKAGISREEFLKIVDCNDLKNWSFNNIADYIEANL